MVQLLLVAVILSQATKERLNSKDFIVEEIGELYEAITKGLLCGTSRF